MHNNKQNIYRVDTLFNWSQHFYDLQQKQKKNMPLVNNYNIGNLMNKYDNEHTLFI